MSAQKSWLQLGAILDASPTPFSDSRYAGSASSIPDNDALHLTTRFGAAGASDWRQRLVLATRRAPVPQLSVVFGNPQQSLE